MFGKGLVTESEVFRQLGFWDAKEREDPLVEEGEEANTVVMGDCNKLAKLEQTSLRHKFKVMLLKEGDKSIIFFYEIIKAY